MELSTKDLPPPLPGKGIIVPHYRKLFVNRQKKSFQNNFVNLPHKIKMNMF